METVHILADQEVQSKALRGLLPPARLLLLSYKIPPPTVPPTGKQVFKTPASGDLSDLNHKCSQPLDRELGLAF